MRIVMLAAVLALAACGGAADVSSCGQQCVGAVDGPSGTAAPELDLAVDGGVISWRRCFCARAMEGLQPFVYMVSQDETVCAAQKGLWERYETANCL